MALLEVKDLRKSFGNNEVLKGITFDLNRGEVLAVIGSSGSGKTTLLRCLNFLETADSGTISVDGETLFDGAEDAGGKKSRRGSASVREKRLHFGLVFQQFNLFPHYNVITNIKLAAELLAAEKLRQAKADVARRARTEKAEARAELREAISLLKAQKLQKTEFTAQKEKLKSDYRHIIDEEIPARAADRLADAEARIYGDAGETAPGVAEAKSPIEARAYALLERVGLSDKAKAYPGELSGGQQQRVAIARALALAPDILCFDEPTSALDPELTGEVLKVIKGLKSGDSTMIVVTHEMEFARNVADKVIFMADGVIEEMGSPYRIFEEPQSEKTKAFLQKSHDDALGEGEKLTD